VENIVEDIKKDIKDQIPGIPGFEILTTILILLLARKD